MKMPRHGPAFLRTAAFALPLFFCCGLAAERPPNVILIVADDLGYADVGVYGAQGFATPNLDRLAHEGIRFKDFHVAQAVCSASRAAILTGCYPNRVGIEGAMEPWYKFGLHERELTLPQMFKA